ncbi:unnamed protein product [Chrysoparadoxa australica]
MGVFFALQVLLFLGLQMGCIEAFVGVRSPALPIAVFSKGTKQGKSDVTGPLYMALGGPEEIWQSYLGLLDTAPLLTKSVTAGIIFPFADFAAQSIEASKERKANNVPPPLDTSRVARFCIFGFLVQAPWNHFFFGALDQVLPPTTDAFSTTSALKVAVDQGIQAPIFTIIIFYVLGLLEGKEVASIEEQLETEYVSTMKANWKLWIPASAVNIAFCPPELRVLFVNCVFFVWSIFLSLVLNQKNAAEEDSV